MENKLINIFLEYSMPDENGHRTMDEADFSKVIKEIQKTISIKKQVVPYQLCPKCQGQGIVSRPSGIPVDVLSWVDSGPYACDVCNGVKIITQAVIGG